MTALHRILILGESGDLCLVGNQPSKDHKTVISYWRWLHFHQGLLPCMTLTTVVERAMDTFLLQQQTVFCGDLSIPENWTCQLQTQSEELFLQRLQLYLLLNPHCTMTQSTANWTSSANSFHKTISANYLKPNPWITGLNSRRSSINMIMMTFMMLIVSSVLKSIARPWSLLEVSPVEISQLMIWLSSICSQAVATLA